MKLRITIGMDNAAFAEAGNGREAARILHAVADRMDDHYGPDEAGAIDHCRDANGNTVGSVVLEVER
jgi:hypothetical protein